MSSRGFKFKFKKLKVNLEPELELELTLRLRVYSDHIGRIRVPEHMGGI